jgi:hypothetical protein
MPRDASISTATIDKESLAKCDDIHYGAVTIIQNQTKFAHVEEEMIERR